MKAKTIEVTLVNNRMTVEIDGVPSFGIIGPMAAQSFARIKAEVAQANPTNTSLKHAKQLQ